MSEQEIESNIHHQACNSGIPFLLKYRSYLYSNKQWSFCWFGILRVFLKSKGTPLVINFA